MPTGYTSEIIDGKITTFPDFAILCMKAFGATIHMRDEPLSKKYEPRVPSDYYANEMRRAEYNIELAKTISDNELITNTKIKLQESKKYHLDSILKNTKNKIKLKSILKEAIKWNPPTKEHERIKTFMIEQIEMTLKSDCDDSYHNDGLAKIENELSNINAKNLREELILNAEKDYQYYLGENNKEIKRCEDSNKWVDDLIESLV